MSALNLAAAIAQAQQSVARHESQNAGDPFHFGLTEHRYVALRDLLDALSTPPADDVREALIAQLRRPVWDAPGYATEAQAPMVADAVLAAFEVRPRGTVTDTEALAKAWDDGVRTAGAYGHEDTWTHDMTPYTQNPYRGEPRS